MFLCTSPVLFLTVQVSRLSLQTNNESILSICCCKARRSVVLSPTALRSRSRPLLFLQWRKHWQWFCTVLTLQNLSNVTELLTKNMTSITHPDGRQSIKQRQLFCRSQSNLWTRAAPDLQLPERVSSSGKDAANDKEEKLHWQAPSLDNYRLHWCHVSSLQLRKR